MTEKELNNRIANLESMVTKLLDIVGGSFSAPVQECSYTFGEWLMKWFDTYKANKQKNSTRRENLRYIDNEIIPALGEIPLSAIDDMHVQSYLNNMTAQNVRIKQAQIINGALKKAVKNRLIKFNPFDYDEMPKIKAKHYIPLEFEQQNAILGAMENDLYIACFWFINCTGLRIGEFLALDFTKDIDSANCLINISKNKDIMTGEIYDTPKNESSIRKVPFTFKLMPYINILKAHQAIGGDITYAMVSCYFKRVYKKLGYKGLNLHSFRHTFASLCYYLRIPEKYIQSWLGHSTLDMTVNTYTHILKGGTSPLLDYIQNLWGTVK